MTRANTSAADAAAVQGVAVGGGIRAERGAIEGGRDKVWPNEVVSANPVTMTAPMFGGVDAFNELCDHLYEHAESKHFGAGNRGQALIRRGELGYYISARGNFHTLGLGAHSSKGLNGHSRAQNVSLNQDEVHLPPADPTTQTVSQFHVVRVMPGQLVAYTRGGVSGYMTAGENNGVAVPGYHLVENDRTFVVTSRIDLTQPRVISQSGPNWIINVPPGELCKAYVGGKPVVLSAGDHAFNDANFHVPMDGSSFVSSAEARIHHGNLHIIRLRQGELMAVKDGGRNHLLGAHQLLDQELLEASQADMMANRDEDDASIVYRINSPLFSVLTQGVGDQPLMYNSRDPLMQSGPLFIANVPKGRLLPIWRETQAELLAHADKPHVFNDASVRLANTDPTSAFVNASDFHIQHGNVHLIRLRQGQLLAVQDGAKNYLLGAHQLLDDEALAASKADMVDNKTEDGNSIVYRIDSPTFRVLTQGVGNQPLMYNSRAPLMQSGPLFIANVPKGQLLPIWRETQAELLDHDAKPYVFNDPSVRLAVRPAGSPFVNAADFHVQHGNVHRIRLLRGQLLAVKHDTQYHLLGAHQLLKDGQLGESHADMLDMAKGDDRLLYEIDSPLFEVLTQQQGDHRRPLIFKTSDALIQSGPMFIANVREGTMLRIWKNGRPVFLEPKEEPYVFNDPNTRLASEQDSNLVYRYPALVNKGENVIRHGTECRIRVPDGQVYLGNIRGHAVMLGAAKLMQRLGSDGASELLKRIDPEDLKGEGEADQYIITDPSFKLLDEHMRGEARYVRSVMSSEEDIVHGNVTIVNVNPGFSAVVKQGSGDSYAVLQAGRHIIEGPQQTLLGKLPCPEQRLVMDLESLDVQTKDFHELKVSASIGYRIAKPELAVQQADLQAMLQKQCHSALGRCISSTTLEGMGSGNVLHQLEDAKGGDVDVQDHDQGGVDEAFHRAFDSAKQVLSATLESIGVELVSLNIQQWAPVNEKVHKGLEDANLATLEAHRNVATAEAKAKEQAEVAKGNAEAMRHDADGQAAASNAKAEADKLAAISAAEAAQRVREIEAEGVLALAKAQAEAAKVKAEAEANAITLRGEAEAGATLAKMKALEATPSGQWQVQMMQAQMAAMAGMFKGANLNMTPGDMGQVMAMMLSNPMVQRPGAMLGGAMPGGNRASMFGGGVPSARPESASVAAVRSAVDGGKPPADEEERTAVGYDH